MNDKISLKMHFPCVIYRDGPGGIIGSCSSVVFILARGCFPSFFPFSFSFCGYF